jgi:hypothetical protein
MVSETDLSAEKKWLSQKKAETVIQNLRRKNINALYVDNIQEALEKILDMIPEGVLVVRGDSVTVDQIGIFPALKKRRQNKLIDPLERNPDGSFVIPEDRQKRFAREAFEAGVFISGVNAITLDGKLVFTDGRGNRVAPVVYGPDKVILVAGVNKIVNDLPAALQRIREVAAPLNARRHFTKHQAPDFSDLPCVRTGKCADCSLDWRICNYTVIIEGAMIWEKNRINLVLVGEELGI